MIAESPTKLSEIERTGNPFPGLRPFDEGESHLFYGREGQSKELLAKLRKTHFLAVVGMSGSGKSSLVRAGLLSEIYGGSLGKSGSGWHIAMMRPGNDPIGNLARALNESGVLDQEGKEVNQLQTHVTLGRSSMGLVEAVLEARLEPHENLLVVVDQFEELFRFARISEDEEYANHAAAFVELLLEAKRQKSNIYVVLTMRSDYLGDCDQFWDLPEAINEGQYLIPRMTRDQRREAIVRPPEVYFATITPGLINQLLNDMGESPNQLPILQHALMRIWETWYGDDDRSAPLDLCHYRRIGGLAEILSRHADEAYDELKDERHRQIAEKLFKCLTEKGKDDKETRRPTELREICLIADASEEEVIAVIDVFRREGRCFLMPAKNVPLESSTSIDISHESLISCWEKLDKWVKDEADWAGVYRRLVDDAIRYRTGGLWRGNRLQEALKLRDQNKPNVAWASRHHARFYRLTEFCEKPPKACDEEIFQRAMTFLDESKSERDREIKREKEKRRIKIKQVQLVAAALAGVSVIIGVLAAFAWWQKSNAQYQAKVNQILRYETIMNQAQRAYNEKNFAKTNQSLNTISSTELSTLRGIDWYYLWRACHNEKITLKGHKGRISSIDFSPDGKMLATGSEGEDHPIKLWDLSMQKELTVLGGHGAILSIKFSPDGKMLAAGSADSTIRLWDVDTWKELVPLKYESEKNRTTGIPSLGVPSIAFSKDGKTLAAGGYDGGVRFWDMSTRTELEPLKGYHKNFIASIAFSRDDKVLATGSGDGTVKLWHRDTSQGELVQTGRPNEVFSVAFSPAADLLAIGSGNGSIRLLENGRVEIALLTGHTDAVLFVAFSPDGQTLASGSADGSIKLWDMAQLRFEKPKNTPEGPIKEMATLKGHSRDILTVAFSPDGKTLASGSADWTTKLWDTGVQQERTKLNGHSRRILSVKFSPDGKMLATGSEDHTIKLWDWSTHQELKSLKGDSRVLSIAFSPDSKMLASGNGDEMVKIGDETVKTGNNTVKIWNVETKQEGKPLWGHTGAVTSVAFSPDGQTLASGSADKSIKLWDVISGRELMTLNGHSKGVLSVAFSPDGRTLASGSDDGTIKLWDTKTGQELKSLEKHTKEVVSIAFSPDGKILASGSADNTAKLWKVSTGAELSTLYGHIGPVLSVVFSSSFEDQELATGSYDGSVKLWDMRVEPFESIQQELVTLKSDSASIWSIAFSPDRMMLATAVSDAAGAGDSYVELWRAASPEEVSAQQR